MEIYNRINPHHKLFSFWDRLEILFDENMLSYLYLFDMYIVYPKNWTKK